MDLKSLKTGDIILFTPPYTGFTKYLDYLITYGTHSDYTHVGMILKDPTFIHPELKGTYVWESSWNGTPDPQDCKIKLGVQITPLYELLNEFKESKVIIRKIQCKDDCFSDENLKRIHNIVYSKPYDLKPTDWIFALFRKDMEPQKTDRFWCSALVGYIYTKCGILDKTTDWSILRPSDFTLDGEELMFINEAALEKKEIRIN